MLRYITLFILFSIFSFLSWSFFGLLFLFNVIILFYLIDLTEQQTLIKKIIFVFPFFISFNISSTFWLFQSDQSYSFITFFVNSTIMLFFFMCGTYVNKNAKLFYIFIWVTSEWLLTKWDLSWPWLIFGNVLGNQWYLIQWYSLFGVFGGSFWLLITGLTFYKILIEGCSKKKIILVFILLSFPFFSTLYYLYPLPQNKTTENFVCYNPDRSYLKSSNYNKTKKMITLLNKQKIENNSRIIVPEAFYFIEPYEITSGNLSYLFKNYFRKNNVQFIIGSEIENDSTNRFNGISFIDNSTILFRTKKKYVPISEYTPKILTPFFGRSTYLKNKNDDNKIIFKKLKSMPFVCYEILFSDFVANHSYNSNLIILLASEDFMHGSFFGKKQYNDLIRIRAIENNRYLIKNSFKGSSFLISPKGDIVEKFLYPVTSVRVPIINKNTFYQDLIHFINYYR